jgi:hypothetical protein
MTRCYDCDALQNHVAVFTGLTVDELEQFGGFECQET